MSAEDIIIKLKRGVSGGAQPSGLTHGELAINTTDVRLYVGSLTGSTVAVNNRFFSGAETPAYPVEGDRWYNGTYESVYISASWQPVGGITGTFNPANLLLFVAGASGTGGITFSGNVTITNTLGGSTNILNGLTVQGGITGTLLTTQQQNVTLLGTLSSLTASGLVSANAGLSASSIFVSNGATFNGNISAPNIVNSVNDITGQASITSGSNIIITQSGKQITIAAAATPAVVATSSVTGVASFRAADFDVSATGSVSLTGNVARTHIGQTFTGLQVFSSGLSANGLTGTILTPAQPNITSVGTLTSLNSTGLITTTSGLSANNINIASGATFGGAVRIFGDLLVSGGITTTISENVLIEDNYIILNSNATVADSGGIEVYRGLGNTNRVIRWNESSSAWQFTNDGTNYLNIGAVGSLPIATASTTGVAFFPHTDFSVTSLGGVSLTGNVARTHIGQTFTGLQVFSSGLSANGFTGTLNTAAQPNITSVGTLTSLTTAGLTSTQRVNVSSGGIVVQAGGLSVTGGISATGGANFYGLVGINASGSGPLDNFMVFGNYGLYVTSLQGGGTSQYFNIRSAHADAVISYDKYDVYNWGATVTKWIGRWYGGGGVQNAYIMGVVDDLTNYPNQNTHTTFNTSPSVTPRDAAVIYIGSGSSGGNTRPSLYAEQGAVLAASGGTVGIGTNSPSAKLDVNGTFRASSNATLSGGLTTNNLFVSQGTTFASGFVVTRGGSEFGTVRLDTGNNLLYNSWNGHIFQNGSVERLRIDPTSGFVGIGTNSPTQAIDVSGNAAVRGSLFVGNGVSVTGGITGTINTAAQPNITSLGTLASLNTAGITSTQTVNVSSGGIVVQAGGLSVTGGMSVTGSTIQFSSSNTNTAAVTINAPSLNPTPSVGALAINSPEPDIYLNDTNGGWATINIADAGVERIAFGKNSGNDFYLAVRDPSVIAGAWRDEAFVVDSSTGISRFGFSVGISGALVVTGGINGTLVTPSQPNITSVGVLDGLSVNNRVTITGGISLTGGIHIGFGGGTLTAGGGIYVEQGLNVAGGVILGTINTPDQGQITNVGSLSKLITSGITSSQRINVTNGGLSASGGIWAQTGGLFVQAGGLSVTGGSSITGGATVYGDIEIYNGAFVRSGGLSVTGGFSSTGGALIHGGLSVTGGINSSDRIYSETGYEIGSSTFNRLTTGYTLAASDDGKVITINSSTPVTLTADTSVGFTGFSCTIIQLGSGQITVRPSSVTINSYNSSYLFAGQHAAATLLCYSTNILNLSGNLVS